VTDMLELCSYHSATIQATLCQVTFVSLS